MGAAAEHAQHVGLVRVCLGQCLAVAYAHHLRAALFVIALETGNMREIFRLHRIGDVDDRGTVVFGLPGEPVEGLGHLGRAAVMADIGNVAIALMVDGRLIGAARLQVVIADQPHVFGFRRIAQFRRLRERRQCARSRQHGGCTGHRRGKAAVIPSHHDSPGFCFCLGAEQKCGRRTDGTCLRCGGRFEGYASAFLTRSGVKGVWRRRTPVSWARALPIAGVTNGVAICPAPVGGLSVEITSMCMSGTSLMRGMR